MPEIWECYGHGVRGVAIVSAHSRALALQACFEWLGWLVCVAFRKPEQFTLWANCGGSAERPVVYAEDSEHFAALERQVTAPGDGAEEDWQNGGIATPGDGIVEYGEDKP